MIRPNAKPSSAATIPAVAYYRMSSDRQELSIPQQVQAVERYAAEHGYRIVRDYRDEGISGDATHKRHGFKQMVLDADRGDFKVVLAWDQDRIGRFDPIEAGYWLQPLREAGVSLVTVNQGVIDLEDFAGQIVFSVTQASKHAFLKDMAKAVVRGQINRAASGKRTGGAAPFGYRLAGDGKMAPDAEEAAIVRRIFAEYDAGHSLREIAERLNAEGIAPLLKRRYPGHPRACDLWRGTVIGTMLTNVAYIGTLRWNATQAGKYARARNGAVAASKRGEKMTRNEADAVVIENNHEPIVERAVFDRVNAKLSRNTRSTSPDRLGVKPLVGLCRCGHCGGPMTYTYVAPQETRHRFRYLICQATLVHGRDRCERRTVREDVLLPTIAGVVRDRLLAPENATRLREALRRLCERKATPVELDRLKRQAVTLEDEIAKARRRVIEVDADMLGIVQEHLRELRRKHEDVAAKLRDLEWQASAGTADIDATVSRAVAAAERLADRLAAADPRALREALRETVERVDVFVEREMNGRRVTYRFDRGVIHVSDEASACLTQAAS